MQTLLAPLYSAVHGALALGGWIVSILVLVALIGAIFVIFPNVWPLANKVLTPLATTIGKYAGIFLDWFLADLEGGLPILFSSGKTVIALAVIMAASAFAGVQYEKHEADLRSPVPSNCQKAIKDLHAQYTWIKKGTKFRIIK